MRTNGSVRFSGALLVATFAKFHTLTSALTQEVEFRATDHRVSLNFDLLDLWRMNRELTFDTFTGDNSANHEHFPRARTTLGDDRTGKDLDPFFRAFLDLRMDVYGITDLEGIHFFLEIGLFNGLKNLLAHDRRTLPVY